MKINLFLISIKRKTKMNNLNLSLANEMEVDYDEYTSHENLDLRDCLNCQNFHQNYLCLEIGNGTFVPELPFYCSKFELIDLENKQKQMLFELN